MPSRKRKEVAAAIAAGAHPKPRGAPPRDSAGERMEWDAERGIWSNEDGSEIKAPSGGAGAASSSEGMTAQLEQDEQEPQGLPHQGNAERCRANAEARRHHEQDEEYQAYLRRFQEMVQQERARWARTALSPMAGPIEHTKTSRQRTTASQLHLSLSRTTIHLCTIDSAGMAR